MLSLKSPDHHLLALAAALFLAYLPCAFCAVLVGLDLSLLDVREWFAAGRLLWAVLAIIVYVVILASDIFKNWEDC